MSQSTFEIDGNGGGLGVRLAVQAALIAITTSNSGATEPPVRYPFMPWADTGNNLMKQRNATNTAWLTVGPLDQPGFGTADKVGDYKMSARPSIERYLLCDGSTRNRSEFPELFGLVGTFFGAGNGTTTFNLPDSSGRAVVLAGAGAGLTPRSIGQKFGAETHSLTGDQTGTHNHNTSDGGHSHTGTGRFGSNGLDSQPTGKPELTTQVGRYIAYSATDPATSNISILPSGSGAPHNNLPPSLVVGNLFIRALS